MIAILAAIMLSQGAGGISSCNGPREKCFPWEHDPIVATTSRSEHVGKGPYVLVISEVNGGMTKINYRSGAACIHARDEARSQIGGVRLQAFCVPQ